MPGTRAGLSTPSRQEEEDARGGRELAALPRRGRLARRRHREHGPPHGCRRTGRQRAAQPTVRTGAGRIAAGVRPFARSRVPARSVRRHEREDPRTGGSRRLHGRSRGAQRLPRALRAHRAGGLCATHQRRRQRETTRGVHGPLTSRPPRACRCSPAVASRRPDWSAGPAPSARRSAAARPGALPR